LTKKSLGLRGDAKVGKLKISQKETDDRKEGRLNLKETLGLTTRKNE